MSRKLKTIGLTLVAALAMSAMAAASASATVPKFTADSYPAHLSGEDTDPNSAFTALGGEIKCAESTFTATLNGPSASLRVAPSYEGCAGRTVTTNGCEFVFGVSNYDGEHEGTGDVSVDCPNPTDRIEVHIYHPEVPNHGLSVCTINIPEQNNLGNAGGPIYTIETGHHIDPETEETVATPSTDAIVIMGTIPGITYSWSGLACGSGEASNGLYHANITLTGLTDDVPPVHTGVRIATYGS